jgi:rare lipoprotein A (peptidoglycan hydrolase)
MAILFATLVTAVSAPASIHEHPSCRKTFTVPMITRAIDANYYGTRAVTKRDRANLRRYVRCARNPRVRPRMHRYWNKAWRAWWQRLHPPMYTQLASWYNDAGETACGFHAYLGVANKVLPCGTKVRFSYHGRSAEAVVQDRGPYIDGRVWDLNEGLAGTLGFDGVDYVQVSVLG